MVPPSRSSVWRASPVATRDEASRWVDGIGERRRTQSFLSRTSVELARMSWSRARLGCDTLGEVMHAEVARALTVIPNLTV